MIQINLFRKTALIAASFFVVVGGGIAQQSVIVEEQRSLKTYPFDDPSPIPVLNSNPKIYPYFKYEGYSHEGKPQDWKVVKMENDYVEVFVLPEVGGKVWGAVEKSTGEEFIYRNEVMKFRNISMRGPWTSGGIEFNFGIIGHHPSTATPVDYVLQENPDGSVSCTVGNIDLPSRTQWRVTIRLPKDKAFFETAATWYNPTPLHQAYYNWMTGAAFAQPDLVFYTPGDQYLEHGGQALPWPHDERGRKLSSYRENNFGPSKSYHVVGDYNDFFGGYFEDAGYGFGHWATYDDMPGQKLWLWALSRSGGIWKDLLTDTDGQYIEFQAGRLFVQYSPGEDVNPITQATFEPYRTDQWREIWFPVKEIGGMSDVSESAVLHVKEQPAGLQIGINALQAAKGTLEVRAAGQLIFSEKLDLPPMGVFKKEVKLAATAGFEVRVPEMDLCFSSNPETQRIDRPFDSGVLPPGEHSAEKRYREAMEDQKFRVYDGALQKFMECLEIDPYHSGAMVGLAELYFDRGEYERGLKYARQALRLDTYDAQANYAAGILYRAKGDLLNAKEALGWAARSVAYRSVAYAQIAEIHLQEHNWQQAGQYARKALDYNRYSLPALEVMTVAARKNQDRVAAAEYVQEIRMVDPLNHFARFEQFLITGAGEDKSLFQQAHRSELPYQTYLELAIGYYNKGLMEEAESVLELSPAHPLVSLWLAYLRQDPGAAFFSGLRDQSPEFVFPFRRETLQALEWANQQTHVWKTKYYLALNLWGKGRLEEAARWLKACGEAPDYPYFYLSRADLLEQVSQVDPLPDLQKALSLGKTEWRTWHALNAYYFDHRQYQASVDNALQAAAQFPDSYVISSDLARAQVYAGHYDAAAEVLEKLQVLPFEGASEGRQLFSWAHLGKALNLLENKQYRPAIEALKKAREWPEHLGVGKPYDPEERLQDYLLAICYEKTGVKAEADRLRQRIVGQTRHQLDKASPLHLLGLNLAEKETAFQMADMLAKMPAGQSSTMQWVLARFYQKGETLATLQKEHPGLWQQPGMKLLEKALHLK